VNDIHTSPKKRGHRLVLTVASPTPGVQTGPLPQAFVANGTTDNNGTITGVFIIRARSSTMTEILLPSQSDLSGTTGTWSATFTGLRANDPMTLVLTGVDSTGSVEVIVPFSFATTPP
jgi:hypothetical protein